MKFSDAADLFIKGRRTEGIRPATLANYRYDTNKFIKYVGDVNPIKAQVVKGGSVGGLNATHFDLAFASMMEEGYTPGSINVFHSSMSAMVKWCRWRGILLPDQNPLGGRRYQPDPPKPRRRLTPAQMKALLALDMHPRDRVLIAIGIYLFLRQGEIATLKVGDVNLETNRIQVSVHKTRQVDLMVIPVELRPMLREWLTWYGIDAGGLKADYYLVPAKESSSPKEYEPVKPYAKMNRISDIVNKHLERVGFPVKDEFGRPTREGVHSLRRSSALNLYNEEVSRGVDSALMTAKSFLHHSSVVMTERYLGLESGHEARNKEFDDRPLFPSMMDENVVDLGERRARSL